MPEGTAIPAPAGPRILVVEDEPAIRALLVRLLTTRGYDLVAVNDGEAALATLVTQSVDLILLDVGLPGADGFAICRAIKANPQTRLTPVVLVTGLNDRQARIEGIEAGADEFLSKPYDQTELIARIASLVRIKRFTDELESVESVIRSLALTIEARDPYTDGHCHRLATYGAALGTELGLDDYQLEALRRGGYLHDVGKIGIPDAILFKSGALTSDEYEQMKTHTVIGDRLCGDLRSLASVRLIVRHHHERRDGSGYPDKLVGDDIPLLAQIIGIVDQYDAITTTRPYRAALPPQHAFDEFARDISNGLHSAALVDAFRIVTDRLNA